MNGLRDGIGKYFNPSTNESYEGDWEQGKKNGQGTKTTKDGKVLKGNWCQGEFEKSSEFGDSTNTIGYNSPNKNKHTKSSTKK